MTDQDDVSDPTNRTVTVDPSGPLKRAANVHLSQGTCVDRYVLSVPLGEGGMGVVYKAYDPELDRRVAIKLVRVSGASPKAVNKGRARLVREAQALAQLTHPNVVTVYDVGTFGDRVFIAMELVEGNPLATWIQEKQPDHRAILQALIDAGTGLAAAHQAGLIHRDIKPDNIVVGDDGRVRVIDFGLARATDESIEESVGDDDEFETSAERVLHTRLTEFGAITGTPAYMAPEQHAGGVQDERTDQFAFCVTAYYVLYGVRPFAGRSDVLANNIKAGRITPRPQNNKTPRRIHDILVRGLSAEAEDRYGSMNELLERLRDDPRQRRWRIAIAAAVAVLLAGSVPLGIELSKSEQPCTPNERWLAGIWDDQVSSELGQGIRSSGRPHASDTYQRLSAVFKGYGEDYTEMRQQTCEATMTRGEQSPEHMDLRMACLDRRLDEMHALINALSQNPDGEQVDKALPAALSMTPITVCADIESLGAAVPPPDNPERRRQVKALRGRLDEASALRTLGRYEDALALSEQAVSEAESLDYPPVLAESLVERGVLQHRLSNIEEAIQSLSRAAELAASCGDTRALAESLELLVPIVGDEQGHYQEALGMHRSANLLIELAGGDPMLEANMFLHLGYIRDGMGDLAAAQKAFEAALEHATEHFGSTSFIAATALNNLGYIHRKQGHYNQAYDYHQQAGKMVLEVVGPDHPYNAKYLNNLAIVLRAQGKFEESMEALNEALEIKERSLGPDHTSVATTLNNIGYALVGEGRFADALPHLERALKIYEHALGAAHPIPSTVRSNVAMVMTELGRYDQAQRLHETSLTHLRQSLGPDHADLAHPYAGLGDIMRLQHRCTEALPYYKEAIRLLRNTFGDDHEYLIQPRLGTGQCEYELGRPAAALVTLSEARRIADALDVTSGDIERILFALAQAQWSSKVDRSAALINARTAYDSLVEKGVVNEQQLAIEKWLRARGAAPN